MVKQRIHIRIEILIQSALNFSGLKHSKFKHNVQSGRKYHKLANKEFCELLETGSFCEHALDILSRLRELCKPRSVHVQQRGRAQKMTALEFRPSCVIFDVVPGCERWVNKVSFKCCQGSFQIEKNARFITVSL